LHVACACACCMLHVHVHVHVHVACCMYVHVACMCMCMCMCTCACACHVHAHVHAHAHVHVTCTCQHVTCCPPACSGLRSGPVRREPSPSPHGCRREAPAAPRCPTQSPVTTAPPVSMQAQSWAAALLGADTYVPGPPYCTYRLRVPASCVLHVPEAQGSLPWAPLLYVRRPRTSLGRAVRSAYRGTTGSTRPSLWRALVATRLTGTPTTGHP